MQIESCKKNLLINKKERINKKYNKQLKDWLLDKQKNDLNNQYRCLFFTFDLLLNFKKTHIFSE